MKINYLDDEDLSFLHRCSEEHLETFTRILTHNENGKPRLSSTLLRNQTFQAMAGHPERYRRNWQLIDQMLKLYLMDFRHSVIKAVSSI